MKADQLFRLPLQFHLGVHVCPEDAVRENQAQTNDAFSEKWLALGQHRKDEEEGWKRMQLEWYLSLYGYSSECDLARFAEGCPAILDAGCGLGYKAAWLARLAPRSVVVAMDFSDAIFRAAERYASVPNLIFVKGDVARTPFHDGVFDLVSCDQVLHHTERPPSTLREFHRITANGATLHTYVYAKKALPRELLDDHFRIKSKSVSREELWEMSAQLASLGRTLSELGVSVDVPDIPLLGIKGGRQDLQRFIYWNFIKCFWNESFGEEASISTNFDWYSPSNAFRYARDEFVGMCESAGWTLDFLHGEPACWSGRFLRIER
jgi:SAM-dependent methyltransferase